MATVQATSAAHRPGDRRPASPQRKSRAGRECSGGDESEGREPRQPQLGAVSSCSEWASRAASSIGRSRIQTT